MKTLLIKIVLLLTPYIILTLTVIYYDEHSVPIREDVFNNVLEGKIQAFIKANTDIIIGGDSRAERQVVPAIVLSHTGRNAVNIATTSCDLVTLYNALKKHDICSKSCTLIISTSIFQVNDGAIDPGYLSEASLLNMSLHEKIVVHRSTLDRLLVDLVKITILGMVSHPEPVSEALIRENGFHGIQENLKLPVNVLMDPKKTNHPWYRNLHLRGARWRIFQETLNKLAASHMRIYIYQPPVSPAWRTYTVGSFIDQSEREFGSMLRAATQKYSNVQFLDFYSNPDARLGNSMYYDIQHLNRAGAEIFTEILMEKIGNDLRTELLDKGRK